MTVLRIDTAKSYKYFLGHGIISDAGRTVSEITGAKQAFLLSDTNVASLYGKRVVFSLRNAGIKTFSYSLPAGEQLKNSAFLFDVLDMLFNHEFSRGDVLVTLGGGTVSDLGGLAAALYLRGMKLVHIPTTLDAMVDSSIGGKNSINLPYGRNIVGTFYQPDGVIADLDLLSTLPEKQLACGYAEVIRCACLDSKKLFSHLEEGKFDMEEVVSRCVKFKQELIEDDETEQDKRYLMGLGSTYARALESFTSHRISHGYAAAIGIANAYRFAAELGECDEECHRRVCDLLKKYNLPVSDKIEGSLLYEEALSEMKRTGGIPRLVVPSKIGKASLRTATDGELKKYFGV